MDEIRFDGVVDVMLSGDEVIKISLPDGTILWTKKDVDSDYVVVEFITEKDDDTLFLIGEESTYSYYIDFVEEMIVDGEHMEPTYQYTFPKAGTHIVKYKMVDNVIPGSKPNYSAGIWSRNKNITKVSVGDNITNVGVYMLFYCTNLKEVNVGSGVKTLSQYALEKCANLEKVVLKNITKISDNNFDYCTNLSSIIIETKSVASLALYTFTGSNNYKVYVPEDLVDKYKAAYNWKNISDKIYPIEK